MRLFARITVFASLLSVCFFSPPGFAAKPVEKKQTPVRDEKFEAELASLFGVRMKTKAGDVQVKQTRDTNGVIRKLLMVGQNWTEIQLDENGDGVLDHWEITRDQKTVVASLPVRGRFMSLVVSERTKRGLLEAHYVLADGGKSYRLLKSEFTPLKVAYNMDVDTTSGDGAYNPNDSTAPSFIPADVVQSVKNIQNTDTTAELQDLFSSLNSRWSEYQDAIGLGCTCEDAYSGSALRQAQESIWKILQTEAKSSSTRLTKIVKALPVFDTSCRATGREKELEGISKAFADIMMTSSQGQTPEDDARGTFLACLDASGLGVAAARMEARFLKMLTTKNPTDSPIRCEFRNGSEASAKWFKAEDEIRIHLTASDDGKYTDDSVYQTPATYKNVLFHELTHATGIVSEDYVDAVVACCGDPSKEREKGCKKLDEMTLQEYNFRQTLAWMRSADLNYIQDTGTGPTAPAAATSIDRVTASSLPVTSGAGTGVKASDIYKKAGLGEIEKGFLSKFKENESSQLVFHLVSNLQSAGIFDVEKIRGCLAKKTAADCDKEWDVMIDNYTKKFFDYACKEVVSGSNASKCEYTSEEGRAFREMINATLSHCIFFCSDAAKAKAKASASFNFWHGFRLHSIRLLTENLFTPAFAATQTDAELKTCVDDNISDFPSLITSINGITNGQNRTNGELKTNRSLVAGPSDSVNRSEGNKPAGTNSKPSRTSAVSPIPASRVDSRETAPSSIEASYRRATDIASVTENAMSGIRRAILPQAVAANSNAGNTGAKRLKADQPFVAFSAKRNGKDTPGSSIANPFQRGIASVDLGVATGAKASGVMIVRVGESDGAAGGAPSGMPRGVVVGGKKDRGGKALVGGNAGPGDGSKGGKDGAGANDKKGGKAKGSVLEGLFTSPYREILPRLQRLDVEKALRDHHISVRMDDGRVIGSQKPIDQYEYNGMDNPLKKK